MLAKAAKLAKLEEYHAVAYPEPSDWTEQLTGKLNQNNYIQEQLRLSLGEYYEPFMLLKTMNEQSAIQARMTFYLKVE